MEPQDIALPSFAQMLEGLSGQLTKAEEMANNKGIEVERLLTARIALDMFPLSSQIQFACVQAEEARARLVGEQPLTVEVPQTLAMAKDVIRQTVGRLRASASSSIDANMGRPVVIELSGRMTFDMTMGEYIRSWALPQFYFHLVTAYSILRHHGVELGKADYVPHMFQFARREEMAG